MSEQCQNAMCCKPDAPQSTLSIHTKKITDSCRDKDCIEDLRVWLVEDSQNILDTATSSKVRCAELIYTSIEVSHVTFNRSQYYIDLTFFYRILADATVGTTRPVMLTGLAAFSKRAVLCGENTTTHIFSSENVSGAPAGSLPVAIAEVLDPMVLSSRVVPSNGQDTGTIQIPQEVRDMFDGELIFTGEAQRLLVTLGQFSIIRLERSVQLIVPVLDYSLPTKECCDNPGCTEDPCQVFSRIPFPSTQFTPGGCGNDYTHSCDCSHTT